MFSGLRNVVETLSNPPLQQDEPANSSGEQGERSHSPSAGLSSTELAESALSNLRKSLASRRAPSPSLRSVSLPEKLRPSLEERLRANFTIGEASNGTTPSTTPRPLSPAPRPTDPPFSPTSLPLPDSPLVSPVAEEPGYTFEEEGKPQPLESSDCASETSERILVRPFAHSSTSPDPNSVLTGDAETRQADQKLLPLSNGSALQGIQEIDVSPKPELSAAPSAIGLESLHQQLKLVEQRFTDVSTSFKRLQAERLVADRVIRDSTPLEGLDDIDGLKDYLKHIQAKTRISEDEIRQLNDSLSRKESHLEELLITHRSECASQSDEIDRLQRQVEEAEASLAQSQRSATQAVANAEQRKAQISRLEAELERTKICAKEEEEKRVKAISLLKTVRAKLVKAEKDKEDAVKENIALKSKDASERAKEQDLREQLQSEIDVAHAERDKSLAGLTHHFNQEIANLKERLEKEAATARGRYESEVAALKDAHGREQTRTTSLITALEKTTNSLAHEKNNFFEQLQSRQAELDSSHYQSESLQAQITELQYQVRKANERLTISHEELVEARREQDANLRGPASSVEDVARMLSAAESKYEAKVAELRHSLSAAERERTELEAEWSRKFREKARELDDLRRLSESSAENRKHKDEAVDELKNQTTRLQNEVDLHKSRFLEAYAETEKLREAENANRIQSLEDATRLGILESQIQECKTQEALLKANNKVLREELRKVQSSVTLLDRQRNSGAVYRSHRPDTSDVSEPRSSVSFSSSSREASPASTSPQPVSEEEINLEYLRNVILQFFEHKEMRPNLVRVLSVILHFTPQETRRLLSKVG